MCSRGDFHLFVQRQEDATDFTEIEVVAPPQVEITEMLVNRIAWDLGGATLGTDTLYLNATLKDCQMAKQFAWYRNDGASYAFPVPVPDPSQSTNAQHFDGGWHLLGYNGSPEGTRFTRFKLRFSQPDGSDVPFRNLAIWFTCKLARR